MDTYRPVDPAQKRLQRSDMPSSHGPASLSVGPLWRRSVVDAPRTASQQDVATGCQQAVAPPALVHVTKRLAASSPGSSPAGAQARVGVVGFCYSFKMVVHIGSAGMRVQWQWYWHAAGVGIHAGPVVCGPAVSRGSAAGSCRVCRGILVLWGRYAHQADADILLFFAHRLSSVLVTQASRQEAHKFAKNPPT